MGRKASGREFLEQAKACLTKAKRVEELRQAQAVVLPLQFGLSRVATAQAVGLSVGWACQLRRGFVRAGGVLGGGLAKKGGRRHENMTRGEEAAFLAPFFEKAKVGGILIRIPGAVGAPSRSDRSAGPGSRRNTPTPMRLSRSPTANGTP